MTAVAPSTPWQLVVRASRHCPEQLAACSCTPAPDVPHPTSWCVDSGSLAISANGLSYTRRTIVEPRWAYTEHVEAAWVLIHRLLHQAVAGSLLVALRAAHLEHQRLERELIHRTHDAALAWTRPDAAALTAATSLARRRVIDHTRSILSPLVQAALTTAVPTHMEEDDVTLTLDAASVDEPIPYTLTDTQPGPVVSTAAAQPLSAAARQLYADVCWLSAGQPQSVEALVEGLASLGWQKRPVRS